MAVVGSNRLHRAKETKSRPKKLGIPDTERCIPDGSSWNSPKLEMDGRRSDATAAITIRFSPSQLMCCIQEGDRLYSWGSLGEYTLSKGVWSTSFTPTIGLAFNFLAREAPAQKSPSDNRVITWGRTNLSLLILVILLSRTPCKPASRPIELSAFRQEKMNFGDYLCHTQPLNTTCLSG